MAAIADNAPSAGTESNKVHLKFLLAIFFLSGFAGLIYESIWTHYLKLFLGHAAYAQTLVLSIFMLGMAVGSWLESKLTFRTDRFFLVYAAVELLLGIFALTFHQSSLFTTQFFFDVVAPSVADAEIINLIKWALAALQIIPQSILIGMTFPLMANGLLSVTQTSSGKMLSLLYFSNSIGASVGVLASGFLLINWIGLPGTIRISGCINIAIAAVIYVAFGKPKFNRNAWNSHAKVSGGYSHDTVTAFLLLGIIFFTGLASFIYEIVWIRLLSLVLGSATHSFELMLSAFILGLAIGGYVIRNYVDKIRSPLRALGIIQIAMGVTAVISLIIFNYSFEVMQVGYHTFNKVIAGYHAFNLLSHLICLLIMLPATILAGMTLPIIINVLTIQSGNHAIGQAYAFNTVGSIAGILLAVHIIIPLWGVKNALLIGAGIDIVAGLVVYEYSKTYISKVHLAAACVTIVICFSAIFNESLNTHKLASGVFRNGAIDYNAEVVYYKDGKTASVAVTKYPTGHLTISTNGKPDASILPAPKSSRDEPTQVLVGMIPILVAAQNRNVAIIGFGSGMSTHAVLTDPTVESVDTIEIEPAMVEGARLFYEKSHRAFDDVRSHIIYEDAKTYFASQSKKYDVIIAEPSNPWVSGVSSLFTTEFYGNTKRYLNESGVFAQWVQTYELSTELFASIANAFAENFRYFDIYSMDGTNLLFIGAEVPIPAIDSNTPIGPEVRELLETFDIKTINDLQSHYIGDQNFLAPIFSNTSTVKNSDYYPVVDQHAVRARYLGQTASGITRLNFSGVPLNLIREKSAFSFSPDTAMKHVPVAEEYFETVNFYDALMASSGKPISDPAMQFFLLSNKNCPSNVAESFPENLSVLLPKLWTVLSQAQLKTLIPRIKSHACLKNADSELPAYQQSHQVLQILSLHSANDHLAINQAVTEVIIKLEVPQTDYTHILDLDYLKLIWLWSAVVSRAPQEPPFDLETLLDNDDDKNWVVRYLMTMRDGHSR